jgi:hypothetical protein
MSLSYGLWGDIQDLKAGSFGMDNIPIVKVI